MDRFVERVEREAESFGSIPFWSLNDKLEPEELRRQIRRMHELKMKGFFMHARTGLETEYMSEDWFRCVEACADEAEKLGMEPWLYDENGWPSGFAGGILLEDPANFALYLTMQVRQEEDPKALRTYKRPEGGYYCIYREACDSYVNTLDPAITDKFIQVTHEQYKKRFGNLFGRVIPGFFTDEPQYYRWATPWSDTLPEAFEKAYGYDIFSNLIAMFIDCEGAEEYRYDYWYLCHRLFTENFAKPIYEWAEANGCKITGHTIEETTLSSQMWCTGGVMPFYQYEHIPGIDHLCRGLGDDLGPKQVTSVAAQLGRRRVLVETFAACGWDVTPLELKNIAQWQYSSGINLMCQHLYPYSIRGQRKTDYPCFYSEHLPWQDAMKNFNSYFNRLGAALSQGKERVTTLVIHPMHSAYLKYKRDIDYPSIAELEQGIVSLVKTLSENQILYHWGDELLMGRFGSVSDGKIKVGQCTYDTVLLPLCYTLDATTAALLKEFLAQGGKLAAWNPDCLPDRIDGRIADMSWLIPNTSFEALKESSGVRVFYEDKSTASSLRLRVMDREDGQTFYLVNLDMQEYKNVRISLGVSDPVMAYDPETGEKSYVSADGNLTLTFGPAQGYVLYTQQKKALENALTLDYATTRYGNGETIPLRPIAQIRDLTLQKRYEGIITLGYQFTVGQMPTSAVSMAVEPMQYQSVQINGTEVSFSDGWWLDRSFRIADITAYLREGINEISLTFSYFQRQEVYDVIFCDAMESRRNCLCFDTEIENIYLFGHFGVYTDAGRFVPDEHGSEVYDGDFRIGPAPNDLTEAAMADVVRAGYPFYGGEIEGSFVLEAPEDYHRLILRAGGHFSYADIYMNGGFVKRLIFEKSCDVTAFARPGKNECRAVICNSARNLLGPHHHRSAEPYVVSPDTFTGERGWNEEGCNAYRDSYSFMPFGISFTLEAE